MKKVNLSFVWLNCVSLLLVTALSCGRAETPTPPAPPAIATAKPDRRADWQVKWDRIVEGAKKEGELRIYAGFGTDARTVIQNLFKKNYGINVEMVVGRGAELTNKLNSEKQAGLYLADVTVSGVTNMFLIRDHDLLQPIRPTLILPDVLKEQAWKGGKLPIVDQKGYVMVFIGNNQRFLGINTQLVKEGEIKSGLDILAPKWKGKISLNDPSISGSANSHFGYLAHTVWGVDKTKEYLRDLLKQETIVTKDTRQQAEWLARGRHAIAAGVDPEDIVTFIGAGAPVKGIKLAEGNVLGHTGGGTLGMNTRPPHPNAALLFANWLLSQEGQTIFSQALKNPSLRVDVSTEGIPGEKFPEPDEKVVMRDEEMYVFTNSMTAVWRDIISDYLKGVQ